MPHSSGGGSSSGGSHSGSSRERHIRRTYYRGANRYIRYKKNGELEIVYSDRNIGLLSKGVNWLGLIVAGVLAFFSVTLVADEFKPKEPFNVDGYESSVYISDGAYALSNVPKLGEKLDEFQELTGITVCVKTMNDYEWTNDYSSLESYAYDEYLRCFDDEYHWLLIYSKNDKSGKNKWSWEGMQGDNTDPILTSSFADKFTKTVQKSLEHGDTFDIAVEKGLDKISGKIMTTPDGGVIFGALMLVGIISYCAYVFCIEDRTGNRTRYIKVPGEHDEKIKKKRCYTCGNEYAAGTVPVCPYCYNITRYKFDPFYKKKVNEELDSIPHN